MEEKEPSSARSIGLKWGLISGIISIISFVAIDSLGLTGNQAVSFLSFAVAIVLIVLAHKEFKSAGDEFMSYGEGIGVGFWTGTIGGIISGVFTYIYVSFINTEFLENIRQKQIEAMEERGMSDAQIEQAMGFSEAFSGPTAMFVFSILGGIVTYVLLALIISAFTKKSRPELI